jgi:hypothetical protein
MIVAHDNTIDLDAIQRQEADAHCELVKMVAYLGSECTTFAQCLDQLLEVGRLLELLNNDGVPPTKHERVVVRDIIVL